jgi:hypothetical protein
MGLITAWHGSGVGGGGLGLPPLLTIDDVHSVKISYIPLYHKQKLLDTRETHQIDAIRRAEEQ